MSELQTAFVAGLFIGSILMLIASVLLFRLRCGKCNKEHQHEVRIADNE